MHAPSYVALIGIGLLAMALTGCASQKKPNSVWKGYDYRQSPQQPAPASAKEKPKKAESFGACEVEDLTNFSCD